LQAEYSESIDSPTILAILSDYDVCDPAQIDAVRQTLDILRAHVPFEEASGFDASGASGPDALGDSLGTKEDNESVSGRSLPCWKTQTDDTSVGHGMALQDLEGLDFESQSAPSSHDESIEKSYMSELDSLGDEEKEAALRGIFPILTPFDIQWTLKKHKGNTNFAIDELMTQSFLEENGSRHKGIDAFYESEVLSKQRKGKKKHRHLAEAGDFGSLDTNAFQQSKWDAAKHDIEFISSKTDIPERQVASLYHKSSGSMPATILAILEAHRTMNIISDDPVLHIHVYDLQQEFPTISRINLESLVQLTHPSIPNAQALARSLTTSPSQSKTALQLEFRHAPINLGATDVSLIAPSKPTLSYSNALDSAASHTAARNSNFEKAAAYYRKGKSDHLMGGAAAYYALEGRNHNVLAKASSSAAADSLVAAQSSRTELDLHGVNVKDALRISRERVTVWWHELGEARVMGGIGGGYRIVTGIGRHSEGGRLKLGPAVGKMLIREGWKVEVGSGVLVVRGIASGKRK
jgi:hypothetical protein